MIGNYLLIYSGFFKETRAQSGITSIIDHKWTYQITKYLFVNDRTITVRLKTNRGHVTIIGLYVPEEGREEEARRFYKQLQKRS